MLAIHTLAALVLAGSVAGCSSSSSTPDGGAFGPMDAGTDTKKPADSGSKDSGKDAKTSVDSPVATDAHTEAEASKPDSGDAGGCTFESFMIDLFKTPADGTPSPDLGQSCPDTRMLIDTSTL